MLFRSIKMNILASFLVFISQIYEFMILKNVLGMEIVGLGWTIEPASDMLFKYTAKPPSFIPNQFQSNVFWISFFLDAGFWSIFLLISLSRARFLNFIVCSFCLFAQIANLLLFKNSLNANLERNDSVVMMNMKDDEAIFELVKDDD